MGSSNLVLRLIGYAGFGAIELWGSFILALHVHYGWPVWLAAATTTVAGLVSIWYGTRLLWAYLIVRRLASEVRVAALRHYNRYGTISAYVGTAWISVTASELSLSSDGRHWSPIAPSVLLDRKVVQQVRAVLAAQSLH